MSNLAWLVGAFAVGYAVGTAYFVALWATLRALPAAGNPALLVFASFAVRFGLAASLFVLLVRVGGLPSIAAALAGFVAARIVMVRRLRPPDAIPAGDPK